MAAAFGFTEFGAAMQAAIDEALDAPVILPNDDERETISLLLLEEPEAHLHPQQHAGLLQRRAALDGAEH